MKKPITNCSKCGSTDITFGKKPNGRCRACNAEGMRALMAKRRADGLCPGCGKEPRTGRKMCGPCSIRMSSPKRAGMSKEYRDTAWVQQNGGCAICTKPLSDVWSAHGDHNHTSGKRRGLLCGGCNMAVGFIESKPWLLDAAEAYLDRWVA